AACVYADVEDRVDRGPELHLELLHGQAERTHVAWLLLLQRLGDQLLGVDRPALDEGAAPQRGTDRRGAPEGPRVRQLQHVTWHRLVHGEVAQHVVVVLAVERADAVVRPVGGRGRHGEESGRRATGTGGLEGPGRV